MSTLRTFNLQNPDSGTVNIEMDQGGNTLMTGIATVRGAAHFTSTSGSDAVGIGTDITAYKLDIRVTGAEAGLRVYNPDTSSNASGMIRLGNDDNQNSAFLKLNGANNSSTVGGAANLVLGTGTARQVHLATNGTSRLAVRSDGKISAGTALDVNNSYEFSIRGADGTGCLYAHGRNHYLSTRSTSHASLTLKKSNSDSDGIDYLQMRDSSNAAKFVVSGDGTLQVLDSIKHMGDTDTLISFPANDTITLHTSGSERLRITSGGQVNIGGNFTQTGFTASITRNSSETDILRIKGNGGNAFIRFEDNDASSSFTLGADDAVGSGGFALYDRSDSAYRVVVDTAGRVCINATSPVQIGGQTPYLYVSNYTNLDGLRIRGLDTGNTIWKTGGDMSLTVASAHSIYLKTQSATALQVTSGGQVATPLQPRFWARRSTDQTGYDGRNVGGTWITYDVEEYDIGGNFATSGSDQGRFIAPVSGLYLFHARCYKQTGTSDWSQSWFDVDGSRKNGTDWVVDSSRHAENSVQIYLTAGQKVGFHPYNNVSSNTILDSGNHTWFKGCLLG